MWNVRLIQKTAPDKNIQLNALSERAQLWNHHTGQQNVAKHHPPPPATPPSFLTPQIQVFYHSLLSSIILPSTHASLNITVLLCLFWGPLYKWNHTVYILLYYVFSCNIINLKFILILYFHPIYMYILLFFFFPFYCRWVLYLGGFQFLLLWMMLLWIFLRLLIYMCTRVCYMCIDICQVAFRSGCIMYISTNSVWEFLFLHILVNM